MRPVAILVALALAACDGTGLEAGDAFVYATDGTDWAVDVVQAPNGDLVVVGSSEGVPRPADGTLALPTVLRFGLDGDLRSAEVYRDLGFGDVQGVGVVDDELIVAVAAGPDDPGASSVTVFRAGPNGRRRDAFLRLDAGYAPGQSVRVLEDGSAAVAVSPRTTASPQLYRLGRSGDATWAVRLGVQGVQAVEPASGGDLYVLGYTAEGSSILRVEGATGTVTRRVVRPDSWQTVAIARDGEGVALLESAAGTAIRVVRLDAQGAERSTTAVLEAAPGRTARASALEVADGYFAVAWTEERPGAFGAPGDSYVAVVGPGGERRSRFGERGRWSAVSALLALEDGRLAAVGVTGPERIGGFGGDDFDVRVTLYDAD